MFVESILGSLDHVLRSTVWGLLPGLFLLVLQIAALTRFKAFARANGSIVDTKASGANFKPRSAGGHFSTDTTLEALLR